LEFAARSHSIGLGGRDLRGLDLGEILELVAGAVTPKDQKLFEALLDQVDDYKHRPPREIANSELVHEEHGFVDWVLMLKHGSSSLPDWLPRVWLKAWTTPLPAGCSAIPQYRCESCLLVLPNSTPEGCENWLDACPSCGSQKLSYANLAGNEKDGWPAAWEYRPIAK
jgi:hypothetical protein